MVNGYPILKDMIWRFFKMGGTPKSSNSLDHFSIETHGELAMLRFKKHPYDWHELTLFESAALAQTIAWSPIVEPMVTETTPCP